MKYAIMDTNNNVYWVRSRHYGYGTGNKAVFETKFTEALTEATLVSKKEAEEVLDRFIQFDFVIENKIKIDATALVIKVVNQYYV